MSHTSRGAAVLLVTHDTEAALLADARLTLRDGRLFEGEPGDPEEPGGLGDPLPLRTTRSRPGL